MAQTSYYNATATVGKVSDSKSIRPSGDTTIQTQPTIPGAIFQTSANTSTPSYTKSSSTVLVLVLDNTGASGTQVSTGSLAGVFWTTAGVNYYCLDCVISSVSGTGFTLTAPGSIPAALGNGSRAMSNFATVTAGTTVITVSIATQATGDLPSNPDVAVTIPSSSLQQLLITSNSNGGTEMFVSGTRAVYWNYNGTGDFYNNLPAYSTTPWAGSVNSVRFYNNSTSQNVMSLGALLT